MFTVDHLGQVCSNMSGRLSPFRIPKKSFSTFASKSFPTRFSYCAFIVLDTSNEWYIKHRNVSHILSLKQLQ